MEGRRHGMLDEYRDRIRREKFLAIVQADYIIELCRLLSLHMQVRTSQDV